MRGEKQIYKRKFKSRFNWDLIIAWCVIIGLSLGFWFLIFYLFICT
jgi:hypothetical protein